MAAVRRYVFPVIWMLLIGVIAVALAKMAFFPSGEADAGEETITPGAEFDPLLSTAAITHEVRKGQGRPDYSAFQGTTETGSSLGELLAGLSVTDLDVVGIATDHCVRASALDALDSGVGVRVLTDLVAGVGEESSEAALSEVEAAGGQLV